MQDFLQQRFLQHQMISCLEKLKAYSQKLKESVQAKDARLQEVGYKAYMNK